MTSFISKTFSFTGHLPETVCAVLATSRTLMNSSIVPVTLSDNDTWDTLCSCGSPGNVFPEKNLLLIFSMFSDTMQFTKKFRLPHGSTHSSAFINGILQALMDSKRYFCRTLQHLDLVICGSIPLVCSRLTNIQSISLFGCPNVNFGDEELKLICTHFTLIKALNLRGKFKITDSGLQHVGNLQLLEDLNLDSLRDITTLSFLKHTSKLQKIDLRRCAGLSPDAFDDCVVQPALFTIDADYCEKFTSHTFDRIQLIAPNLVSLCCTHVPEEAFVNSISAMQNLKTLHFKHLFRQGNLLSSLTTTAMDSLWKHLKHLETFQVALVGSSNNTSFNNSHLRVLSHQSSVSPLRSLRIDIRVSDGFDDEGFGYLTSLKFLEMLEIIYHPTRDSSAVFTGDIGKEKWFPNTLKEVKFQHCQNLSDAGLISILKGLENLEHVTLKYCPLITSEGLQNAFEGTSSVTSSSSSSLTHLDVNGCIGFTDLRFLSGLVSLQQLLLNLTNNLVFSAMRENCTGFGCLPKTSPLRELNMGPGSAIEDEDLAALPPNVMRTLQRLGLSGCRKLTSKSFTETIALSMPNLTWMNIRDCDNDAFTTAHSFGLIENLKYLKKCIVSDRWVFEMNDSWRLKQKYGHVLAFFGTA